MFTPSDAPSTHKTADQLPNHTGQAQDGGKQLVSLAEMNKFQAGQLRDANQVSSLPALGPFENQAAASPDSQPVLDMLSGFNLTETKPAKFDTLASLTENEIAAMLKKVDVNAVSETLLGFLNNLSAENALTSNYAASDAPAQSQSFAAGRATEAQQSEHSQAGDSRATGDGTKISPYHFATVARHLIDKLGTDGDVTREDLAKAMQDPSIKGQDAQVLAAMYQSFDRLADLSGHDIGMFPRITKEDIDSYNKLQWKQDKEKEGIEHNLRSWALVGLSKFAADKQSVTQEDVRKALSNPSTSEYDKEKLSFIDKHWAEIVPPFQSKVSGQDVDTFASRFSEYAKHTVVADVERTCKDVTVRGQAADICHDLYAGDPLECIRKADIKQGQAGDCYFEATLAAIAQANPAEIQKLITDNHDGTYTVDFPGKLPWDKSIVVKAPTEAELGLYNGGSKYGCWASVLEKAFGEYMQTHLPHLQETPEQTIGNGGQPMLAFWLLTGKPSEEHVILPPINEDDRAKHEADMSKVLHAALDGTTPRAVTGTTPRDMLTLIGMGSDETEDGLQRYHVFSITKIYEKDGKEYVHIRNPWGREDLKKGGDFDLPLSDFMKDFSQVSIEGK